MKKQQKTFLIITAVIPTLLLLVIIGSGIFFATQKNYAFSDVVDVLLEQGRGEESPNIDYSAELISIDILEWRGQGANSRYSTISTKYHPTGRPVDLAEDNLLTSYIRLVTISTTEELLLAIKDAKPGDRIELQPGNYRFDKNIIVRNAGNIDEPIVVYAKTLGDVLIEFDAQEGFKLSVAYWTFQNLVVKGACKSDTKCEHAFHLAGDADGAIIRNNILLNFNAAIKSNGLRRREKIVYPDNVLIEKNSIANSAIRYTDNAVTPIDVVGGDNWRIRSNYISDFILGYGRKTSFGIFLKGYSSRGLIEDNLVICNHRIQLADTIQVGISLGGGGTGAEFCHDGTCQYEHVNGQLKNNTIVNCNDVGIYINKGKLSRISDNLLLNTDGIDLRFPETTAIVENNILDGEIRNRNYATSEVVGNRFVGKALNIKIDGDLCEFNAGIRSENINSGVSCIQLLDLQLRPPLLKFTR